jgi:pyruvate formate lyase activating enzyme
MPLSAPVFDIQTLATRDGEGLRTLVFLQGCPLRCAWCANPEGQSAVPQLLWHEPKCAGDLACLAACPNGAVTAVEGPSGARPRFDRRLCDACLDHICVARCPADALTLSGRRMTAEGLFEIVAKDIRLFWNSGGGLTFGGGEPLLYPEFVAAVADRLLSYGVGTVLETCGEWDWSAAAPALERAERIYFDVKTLDAARHGLFTGRTNALISANLRRLAEAMAAKVVVSLPIIPGVQDSVGDARVLGRFLASLGLKKSRLLPYHRMSLGKYAALGRPYPHASWDHPLAAARIAEIRAALEECGIEAAFDE